MITFGINVLVFVFIFFHISSYFFPILTSRRYRKRRNLPNGRPHMIHNNSINSNTNLNGMMAPYPTSRAGSSSSPDSCINGDLDDELIEINKISHHQQTTRSEVTGTFIIYVFLIKSFCSAEL